MATPEVNVGICHDRKLPLDLQEDGIRVAMQDDHDEAGTSSASDTDPTFRALLIGIDLYLPNRLESGATYAPLSGCVNDVRRVEAALHAHVTGPLHIKTLLAHDAGAG